MIIITSNDAKGYKESLSLVQHISNSWDEWVGEERLMKHTEENVLKQQALDKKQNVDKNVKSGRSSQGKAKISTGKPCTLWNGDNLLWQFLEAFAYLVCA